MIFKVETPQGFYYTDGNGRYGRFYGTRWQGEMLCERHANQIVDLYRDHASTEDGDAAHFVNVNGGYCQACRREGNHEQEIEY